MCYYDIIDGTLACGATKIHKIQGEWVGNL